ncbi:AbrB/MazE/SpoVT family DNA-binding domain-containing protein [Archaeoglobus profundus]|uniref:SpoVT/AbrB domain protein n=1 Tax=Archaeoglobus profundus (strain DSM 5631 / JCM 9629 / NBRC 100127 / Av18) TaxID=572546 RepID=D2RDQ7_ARCPA|nr:AbrB/MazE/SpoVT family DNA-binding domain-containing protein [Archaeoglobus profundus]ADB58251.1 SpoVT/AbrB domain protein [Archaeoglobus profundus DSM 5631]
MASDMEVIKELDRQGRLVLPKEWREKYAKDGRIVLRVEGDKITIRPYKLVDLTKFFDKIEVDLKSDLSDWKSVRRELLEVR